MRAYTYIPITMPHMHMRSQSHGKAADPEARLLGPGIETVRALMD